MTSCIDCGRSIDKGARCDGCVERELGRIPHPSTDIDQYAEVLARLVEVYIMNNVEVPRQIAQHPDWTDRQIARAAVQFVNNLMNDPNRVDLIASVPPEISRIATIEVELGLRKGSP